MAEQISQRELRNNSGRIMRGLDEGRSYIVTRRAEPVGELRPLRRRRLVDARAVVEIFADAPTIDRERFRKDLDVTVSQDLSLVPERAPVGLLDISVVIDLDRLTADQLPVQVCVSAITMAELAAGPAAAADADERARRQDRLQRAEAAFDPVPFGVEAARAYGRVYSAVLDKGRKPRRRLADLLIASVAVAEQLPVVTRNAADFAGLFDLIEVLEV